MICRTITILCGVGVIYWTLADLTAFRSCHWKNLVFGLREPKCHFLRIHYSVYSLTPSEMEQNESDGAECCFEVI